MKKCTKCKVEKEKGEFYRNKQYKDGYTSECRICNTARRHVRYRANKSTELVRNAGYYKDNKEAINFRHKKYYNDNKYRYHIAFLKRQKIIKQATLPGHLKELVEIYKNRPEGYHVDHIVPLQGETVCGLHVPWNLQYLTAEENLKKGNKLLI